MNKREKLRRAVVLVAVRTGEQSIALRELLNATPYEFTQRLEKLEACDGFLRAAVDDLVNAELMMD